MLYAAPAWATALEYEVTRAILRRAQKSALVRSTTAYRTVAFQALCVLAGRMPAHLKVGMWSEVFRAKTVLRGGHRISGEISPVWRRSLPRPKKRRLGPRWKPGRRRGLPLTPPIGLLGRDLR